jgi:putative DNA primase/helicase
MDNNAVLIPEHTDLNFMIPKHRDVLPDLLNLIGRVDFRELSDLPPKEIIKKKHFIICVVEEIIRIAKAYNFGLARKYDFFYLYNGAYWQLLDDQALIEFLGKAAEKMGVERFDARHYQFREELLKQFIATAHLQRPEATGTIINLLNGTLTIGEHTYIRPFDPDDFLTYQLPYKYDPSATAPRFMQYLNEVLPDESAQRVISEFLGYVFIPNSILKLEKALLLYGPGANGKSVFFEIVKALLGSENLSSYSLSSLTNETGYYRAEVANKLVNYASEINGNLEAARFKALVSGEPIEARKPYGQAFILQDYARLIFNTNELPRDVEHTLAFFRRFLIIPFSVTIPESRQDKELANRIIESELPGVFNWVLEGLKRVLTQRNFSPCSLAERELKDFQRQSDSVAMFLEDQNLNPDPENWKTVKELYINYRAYCYEDGYKPVGKKVFIKRLNRIGILTERKAPGIVAYLS